MSELGPNMENLARGMLEEDIVKFGKFTLKSGKESVAYVNLRNMISVPRLFDQATIAYEDTLTDSGLLVKSNGGIRHLEAVPEAATYYGGAVARAVSAPLLYHRVKAKEHGQPRAVEGRYVAGDEVVLLDDVITTAGSKVEEAAALGNFDLKVTGAVVLVDREQGGRTELDSQGIDFAAAMTLSGIAKYALDENLAGVTQTLYDSLLGELDPTELGL
ncbi:MAG TPA: phosphoribosyltransferase family protein [Candidatus Dormibacteraeota bacterium]|nr:phosphoribosyltransferase family protein [Candidatus Dormibacteraeota bacterium]